MSFAFWTDEPLPPDQVSLLCALRRAHHASAFRGNISCQAVQLAAAGSRDVTKALAAGLMSIGGPHAPLAETFALLADPLPVVHACALLAAGEKVPGWGNSFFKGQRDPLWEEVRQQIALNFPEIDRRIESVTKTLHIAGRHLFPNPSCYTAATAIIVGLPSELSPYLFIMGRLSGWAKVFQQQFNQ